MSRPWPRARSLYGGLLLALAVALLSIAPRYLGVYELNVLTQILLFGLFAMGFDLVFGYGGMASLGHAAFFGFGAYAVGIGVRLHGLPAGEALAVAVGGGALLAMLFGAIALRTEGIYFLFMTLALGQALWGLAAKQVDWTRGDNGIAGIRRPAPFGYALQPPDHFFYLALACVVFLGVMLFIVVQAPFGRALIGTRESESRMSALGYNVRIYRLGAFGLSGACAGLAGALLAFFNGSVGPGLMDWTVSANVMVAALVGGPGTLVGPLLGAGLVQGTTLLVSANTEHWLTVLGLLYAATILLTPRGVLRLPQAEAAQRLLVGSERLRRRSRRVGEPLQPSQEQERPPESGPYAAAAGAERERAAKEEAVGER